MLRGCCAHVKPLALNVIKNLPGSFDDPVAETDVPIARNEADTGYFREKLDMHHSMGCALCSSFCAQERAALPGPLWRGGWVEESPQDGPHGCGPVFRRYRDVPSENPASRPRTRKAGCLEGAPSGWPFSWVTFSLAIQRESDSGAGRRSKPLCRWRRAHFVKE